MGTTWPWCLQEFAISDTKQNILLVGTGLIGASLGMALRKSGRYLVTGLSRTPRSLLVAKRKGAIDRSATLVDIQSADVVVLCTPIDQMGNVLKKLLPNLKRGVIITDVGSVKHTVEQTIQSLVRKHTRQQIVYVGAHPMAGSHETGPEAARINLFQQATCVILKDAPIRARRVIETMWKMTGARIVHLKSVEHDQLVAFISHLPHLMAYTLVRLLLRQPDLKKYQSLMAGSFRDVTRVAAADAKQWATIFKLNSKALLHVARQFQTEMQRMSQQVGRTMIQSDLAAAQRFRRKLFS